MRATPTIVTYNPAGSNANSRNFASNVDVSYSSMPWGTPSSRAHFGNADTTSTGTGQAVTIHYSATAEL
jgi:hypothetical protein